tara:strand:+ start:2453 stop:3583 length:1131 start_codon:yes stop_codon:yes gene_type:complete
MLRCHGICGKEDCDYETNAVTQFKIHTEADVRDNDNKRKRKKVKCDICGIEINYHSLGRHKKRKHNIQRRTYLRCPKHINQHAFAFIRNIVRNAMQRDINDINNWSEEDQQDLRDMNNNETRFRLAEDVYNRYKALGNTDDYGGDCTGKCKIVLYHHSLFSLSLVWIDHSRPRFADKNLDNLLFTIKGMSQTSSIRDWTIPEDGFLCDQLRREMQREISDEMEQNALERERLSMSSALAKRNKQPLRTNVLYASVSDAYYPDKKAQKDFGSLRNMFSYVYGLYHAAGARCRNTGIFMDGNAYNQYSKGTCPHPFQPSVDAIHPTKGHVKGNIRVVCAFSNSQDHSKRDIYKSLKKQDHGVIPHGWTKELWNHYVGI